MMPTTTQAISRIDHEAERGDARRPGRRRHRLRQAAEEQPDDFDEDDAQAERDQNLVLVRARVEMADDDALHRDAEDEHEEGAGDQSASGERAGILIGDDAGIAADHEHGAMREIEHAQRAVDDRQTGTDQRQKRADDQAR